MTIEENGSARASGNTTIIIDVAGTDLAVRQVALNTDTPTGGDIAKASGFSADKHPYVLQWRNDGELEDIRAHEVANLGKGLRFIVAESSNSNRITIDDDQFDWPADVISGAVVRKLGNVANEKLIVLEREGKPDQKVLDSDIVSIKRDGLEEFKSRKAVWELVVQSVKIDSDLPEIRASDAMLQAGFEDASAWIIHLKVEGQPKRQINATDMIDLRTKGIEKIRLTPKQVDNGEAPFAPRRDFDLLAMDHTYLDGLGLSWEALIEGDLRWLVISNYPVAPGYQVSTVKLALLVPLTYPQAQIDMFHVFPALSKRDGGAIPNLMEQIIGNVPFQTWSRHRGQESMWNPRFDNVVTHLALVDSAIAKEVGE